MITKTMWSPKKRSGDNVFCLYAVISDMVGLVIFNCWTILKSRYSSIFVVIDVNIISFAYSNMLDKKNDQAQKTQQGENILQGPF